MCEVGQESELAFQFLGSILQPSFAWDVEKHMILLESILGLLQAKHFVENLMCETFDAITLYVFAYQVEQILLNVMS